MADEDLILSQATDIANEFERAMHGQQSAACIYAVGMVIAHMISLGKVRDIDGEFSLIRKITESELQRQFSH